MLTAGWTAKLPLITDESRMNHDGGFINTLVGFRFRLRWVRSRCAWNAEYRAWSCDSLLGGRLLSHFSSRHNNRHKSPLAIQFDAPRLAWVIRGESTLAAKRRKHLLTTENVLRSSHDPRVKAQYSWWKISMGAWSGFLRLGEVTWPAAEARKVLFDEMQLTRSDISLVESDENATLRLKRNKIDVEHTGIYILLATTEAETYLAPARRILLSRGLMAGIAVGRQRTRSRSLSLFWYKHASPQMERRETRATQTVQIDQTENFSERETQCDYSDSNDAFDEASGPVSTDQDSSVGRDRGRELADLGSMSPLEGGSSR